MSALSESDREKGEAVPAPKTTTLEIPPEEGLRGWLCVVGGFLCLFCSFGFLNAIGVFQTTYQESILSDYTPSDISWIFTIQLFLMWALGPIWGRLVDTFGPGPVLWPCAVLCVFALCMTSLATEYYQVFLAQGLAFGIGCGGVFSATVVCVGQWFIRRRGLAMGIVAAGSSVGGIIFPIFLDRVIKEVGFYGGVRYTALLMGVPMFASFPLVRGRLPRKKWNREAKWFDVTLFGQKQFATYTFGAYFVMWGLWAPFDYISLMALEVGFSSSMALYLISILNATSVFGRIIPSYMGDFYGHFNAITGCSLGVAVSMLALWLPFNYHHSQAGLIVFSLIFGFFSGGFVSLLMPCAFKTGSIETLGQRFGTFQLVIAIACLTGLPIMGAILGRQGEHDFSGLQIFASVACAIGTLLLGISTFFLSNTQKTWKV